VGGVQISALRGQILTADEMDAHNTFEEKNRLLTALFDDFQRTESGWLMTVPAKSVIVMEVATVE
jgi:alpha-N-arabinofuranosidase